MHFLIVYFKYYELDNELYVNYDITEMTEDYVIQLSKNKEFLLSLQI